MENIIGIIAVIFAGVLCEIYLIMEYYENSPWMTGFAMIVVFVVGWIVGASVWGMQAESGSDVNCDGHWSACTDQCESAADRSFVETTAQSGSGTACPTAAIESAVCLGEEASDGSVCVLNAAGDDCGNPTGDCAFFPATTDCIANEDACIDPTLEPGSPHQPDATIICSKPTTIPAGFIIPAGGDRISATADIVADLNITCDQVGGYTGHPTAIPCIVEGGAYGLDGCSPGLCTEPTTADRVGYNISPNPVLWMNDGTFNVGVAADCIGGYMETGNTPPQAAICLTSGTPYNLTGCTSPACVDPADHTRSIECGANATCSPSASGGGYTCTCEPGFTGPATTDGPATCEIIECIQPTTTDMTDWALYDWTRLPQSITPSTETSSSDPESSIPVDSNLYQGMCAANAQGIPVIHNSLCSTPTTAAGPYTISGCSVGRCDDATELPNQLNPIYTRGPDYHASLDMDNTFSVTGITCSAAAGGWPALITKCETHGQPYTVSGCETCQGKFGGDGSTNCCMSGEGIERQDRYYRASLLSTDYFQCGDCSAAGEADDTPCGPPPSPECLTNLPLEDVTQGTSADVCECAPGLTKVRDPLAQTFTCQDAIADCTGTQAKITTGPFGGPDISSTCDSSDNDPCSGGTNGSGCAGCYGLATDSQGSTGRYVRDPSMGDDQKFLGRICSVKTPANDEHQCTDLGAYCLLPTNIY